MEKNEDITVESVDGLDRVQIPKSLIKIIVFQRKSSFHSFYLLPSGSLSLTHTHTHMYRYRYPHLTHLYIGTITPARMPCRYTLTHNRLLVYLKF